MGQSTRTAGDRSPLVKRQQRIVAKLTEHSRDFVDGPQKRFDLIQRMNPKIAKREAALARVIWLGTAQVVGVVLASQAVHGDDTSDLPPLHPFQRAPCEGILQQRVIHPNRPPRLSGRLGNAGAIGDRRR